MDKVANFFFFCADQVKARNMFMGQLFGAVIGVLVSATMFVYVLWLNDTGKIELGSAEWPAVGAVSQVLYIVGYFSFFEQVE